MVSVRRILEYEGKFLLNIALRLIIYCPVLFTRSVFFVPRQCGPNKLNWAVHEVAINKKSRDRDQFVSSGQMSGILCSVEVNRKKKRRSRAKGLKTPATYHFCNEKKKRGNKDSLTPKKC